MLDVLFFGYICFVLFVLCNSITSLFVECTTQYSKANEGAQIQEQLSQKKLHIREIAKRFTPATDDNSSEVIQEQVLSMMSQPELVGFAAGIDLETEDLATFFDVLSDSGRKKVDLEPFLKPGIKVRGEAKSMDLMDVP